MSLGAHPSDIQKLVLLVMLRLIALGVAIGLLAAIVLTRFLANQLWHVSSTDPTIIITMIILLFAIGLSACILPARHAASVNPAIALRYE